MPGGEEEFRDARRDADLNRAAAEAAAGNRAALERFLRMIAPTVLKYCRSRIGPNVRPQTPDDVSQEILMAVSSSLVRFRPSEVPAMAFVYGIARNKVADALRAAVRDRSDPTEDFPDMADLGIGPEGQAMRATDAEQLRELLERLPPLQRDVLVMRIAMQLSAEETAQLLSSTAGAVRVTQHRALAKLRAMLADQMTGT